MYNWSEFIGKRYKCQCGHIHECDIQHIVVEKNALIKIVSYIKTASYNGICIIADKNTEKAAATKLYEILEQNNIVYTKYVFSENELVPDEIAVGKIITHLAKKCELLIGIGSGVINDLCKFISYTLKIDYFIVATAPSMDGYASDGAALIIDNLKTTYEKVGRPKAIIADTSILKNAPMHLITAGIGDIFGKYICLTDWQLSHIITGEYYCQKLVDIMNKAVLAVTDAANEGIIQRNEKAIGSVMEGLILAGIDMSYSGNSRPASGSEHHMSHYWEMIFLQQGHEGVHHGTKVGVGTIISLMLYKKLAEKLKLTTTFPQKHFNKSTWIANIKNVYGKAAPGVIALEEYAQKNDDAKVATRLSNIKKYKNNIINLAEKLPNISKLIELMRKINAPYHPAQIGVTEEMVKNAIIYAKELRNRYGILQLLFDCGWQEEFANEICHELNAMNKS
ncbi:sn-glycerol-1-phosphate dehydrogenase [Pectinatus sottacetonis]|uniref:sn-glycerol-1-phosphate dehydrogenase n=1 Tax=Pectinatus sottacetonis TaxID=1002795 RepID=UPI0018C5F4DC|nr:sn-glycerol-1-phosphate dehydrogenase [Pectinatus sottacetonis]